MSSPQEKERAVLQALADEYSLHIIIGTIEEAKSATDLSEEYDIPVATAYRRINDLVDDKLLAKERARLTDEGKWYDLYRSTVRSVDVHVDADGIEVETLVNQDLVDRLMTLWGDLRKVKEYV